MYLFIGSKSWNRRAATDGCNGQVRFYSSRSIEFSGIVVRESRLDACDQEFYYKSLQLDDSLCSPRA